LALELTTVALIQDYLSDTTISSATLTVLAGAAEATIARYCGRYSAVSLAHWLSASRVEYIDGESFPHILLKWTPITAISAVVVTTGATTTQTITLTDLECDGIAIASLAAGETTQGDTGRVGFRATAQGPFASWWDYGWPQPSPMMGRNGIPNFGAGRKRVKASYTGGYAAAPADLSLCATMLAAKLYREQGRDPAVNSRTLGDYSESFGRSQDEATLGGLASMLSPYVRYLA
jgi:hypothetical protein